LPPASSYLKGSAGNPANLPARAWRGFGGIGRARVKAFGHVENSLAEDEGPLVVLQDLDQGSEGIDHGLGHGVFASRVKPPASIQSYLNAFGGDAERASQGCKVALFERFGVRVAVGVGEPDVEAAVAGADGAGEPAQGEVLFKSGAVDEFLKWRVRNADAPVGKGASRGGCVETGHGGTICCFVQQCQTECFKFVSFPV